MLDLRKFSPLELFMLIAINLLGALAVVLEFVSNAGPVIQGPSFTVPVYQDFMAYLPSITVSPLNHIMIVASIFLSFLGCYAFLKNNSEVRKAWIYFQVPYWGTHFLAFILIGFYPVAGILYGMFLGLSVYLALNQRLSKV